MGFDAAKPRTEPRGSSPLSETASFAPTGRGAELARRDHGCGDATFSPFARERLDVADDVLHAACLLSIPARVPGQLLERRPGSDRGGTGRRVAAPPACRRPRLVVGVPLERVHPDDRVRLRASRAISCPTIAAPRAPSRPRRSRRPRRASARAAPASLYAFSDSPIRVRRTSRRHARTPPERPLGSRPPARASAGSARAEANASTPLPPRQRVQEEQQRARVRPPSSPRRRRARPASGALDAAAEARSTGSPPVASDARTSRRMSSVAPRGRGRSRRDRRRGRARGELARSAAGAFAARPTSARRVLAAEQLLRAPAGRASARLAPRPPPGALSEAPPQASGGRCGARGGATGARRNQAAKAGRTPRDRPPARRASAAASSRRRRGAELDRVEPRSASPIRPGPPRGRPRAARGRRYDLPDDASLSRQPRAPPRRAPRAPRRARLQVLVVLEHRAERLLDDLRVELLRPSAVSAFAQSIVSATPGGFARSSPRRPATNAAASPRAAPARPARAA